MVKLTIKQRILNECNLQHGLLEQLAKIAEYANGGAFKRALKDEEKEFDKFNGLVKVVQYLFPNEEKELMSEYALSIDPKKQTARFMLEYLSCNRILDVLELLISRMIDSGNNTSKDWGKVYSLQLEWQLNYHTLDINEHLNNIRKLKTNVVELNFFIKLMKCYCYYYKDNHRMSFEISQELKEELANIKPQFIKSVYEVKLNELESYINLWVNNDPEASRENSYKVLENNIGETFNAYAYHTIGLSYFYTSFDMAIVNLKQSIEIYNSINRFEAAKDVAETIEKLRVFWGKVEVDHAFITLENELLQKVNENLISSKELDLKEKELESPVFYYLKGKLTNNTDLFLQSMIQYIKRGDCFWANMPKIELSKLGFNDLVLNQLISINNA